MIRQIVHDLLVKDAQIGIVLAEIADMRLQRIGERARRAPLPAPIEHRHQKAALAKLPNDLDIFFDELGLPVKHDAHAARYRSRRRIERGNAQKLSVAPGNKAWAD